MIKLRTHKYAGMRFTDADISADYEKGDFLLKDNTAGFFANDLANGSEIADSISQPGALFVYSADAVEVSKASATTFATGDTVYINASDELAKTTSSGNIQIGTAIEAGVSGVTYVICDFDGRNRSTLGS